MLEHQRSRPDQRRRPHHRAPGPLRPPPRPQVPRPGAQAGAQRRGVRRLDVRDGGDGDGRPQRRGRPAQGGVRTRAPEPRRGAARLLRRPRAGQGHGRRRRAGVDELPVVPDLHGPGVRLRRPRPVARPGAGLQRLAHRRVVRRPPGPVHPDGRAGHLGPRADRRRDPPHGGQGLSLAELHREPGRPRLSRASTTSTGTRCGGRAATPPPCCPSTSARRAGCRSRRSTRRPT